MNEKKATRIFVVMTLLIIVLVLVLAYVMIIKPKLTGYVLDKQYEAQQLLVLNILYQIQQRGYVEIPLDQNQTLVLVPYQQGSQSISS